MVLPTTSVVFDFSGDIDSLLSRLMAMCFLTTGARHRCSYRFAPDLQHEILPISVLPAECPHKDCPWTPYTWTSQDAIVLRNKFIQVQNTLRMRHFESAVPLRKRLNPLIVSWPWRDLCLYVACVHSQQ